MKLFKLSLFLTLLAAAALPASSQELRLNIPFNFSVGDKTLPAGHYDVKRVLYGNEISWALYGDHAWAKTVTQVVQSPNVSHNPSLVFLKSGDRYALVQIWTGMHEGRELPHPDIKRTLVAQDGKYVEVGSE